MTDTKEELGHLIKIVRLYHAATVNAKQCPGLLLEDRDEEAAARMRTLYDLEDQLFVFAKTFDGEIERAINEYRDAKKELQNHPDIYKSVGGNREEVIDLFNNMYDKQSEMFRLVGIDYHERKVDK